MPDGFFDSADIFGFMLVFARIGAALMVFPGFGETYVYRNVRLALALALSLVLWPLVEAGLPAQPAGAMALLALIAAEILYGVMIGGIARLLVSALHTAGVIIAFQSGLAYAQTVDPNQGTQSALVSSLLSMIGVVLIFASGLHGLLIAALHDSYQLFPAGSTPPFADFAQLARATVAGAFALGVQLAAPFIVYAIVFYSGLGLLQRLLPQLQLFFIAMPLQMLMAFFMISVVVSAVMLWFLEHFETAFAPFLAR